MPRYYLHLRNEADEVLDQEGKDYSNMDELKADVLTAARDIMAGDLTRGIIDWRYRVDAEDETGHIVYTMPFEHAVTIIPD